MVVLRPTIPGGGVYGADLLCARVLYFVSVCFISCTTGEPLLLMWHASFEVRLPLAAPDGGNVKQFSKSGAYRFYNSSGRL